MADRSSSLNKWISFNKWYLLSPTPLMDGIVYAKHVGSVGSGCGVVSTSEFTHVVPLCGSPHDAVWTLLKKMGKIPTNNTLLCDSWEVLVSVRIQMARALNPSTLPHPVQLQSWMAEMCRMYFSMDKLLKKDVGQNSCFYAMGVSCGQAP
jgi:hypothetical protein